MSARKQLGMDSLSFKTNERKTVVRSGTIGRYLAASNVTGYLVYLRQNTLLAAPFDISNLTITGTAQPILDDVTAITRGF